LSFNNADSLLNKIGELQALITEKKYDIIDATEVFPKSQQLDYNDPELQLDRYTIFHPTKKGIAKLFN
jgi:hypothetical protein